MSEQKRKSTRSVCDFEGTAIGSGSREDSRSELFSFNFGSKKKSKAKLLPVAPPDLKALTEGIESERKRHRDVVKPRDELSPTSAGITDQGERERSKRKTAHRSRGEEPVVLGAGAREDTENENVRPTRKQKSRDDLPVAVGPGETREGTDGERVRTNRKQKSRDDLPLVPVSPPKISDDAVDNLRSQRNYIRKTSDELPGSRDQEEKAKLKRKHVLRSPEENLEAKSHSSPKKKTKGKRQQKPRSPSQEFGTNEVTTIEKHVPVSAEEDLLQNFVIEVDRPEKYMELMNSNLTQNRVLVNPVLTKNYISYIGPDDENMDEEFPGITISMSPAFDNIGVGFMKLKPKTVRPFDMLADARSIYFIMNGTVTVRSCGGTYSRENAEGDPQFCLFPKELHAGQCFVVPSYTCFTLENWGTKTVLLGYNLVRAPDQPELPNGCSSP